MKQLVCLVCVLGWVVSSIAQTSSLAVTTNKTTSLIFPFAIKHVDRGSRDIMVQQVKEADNILLVKASGKDFLETNLTVVTSDNSVFDFAVKYENNPAGFVHKLQTQSSASIVTYANSILQTPKIMHGIARCKWDMKVRVSGIFVKEEVLYFQLHLINESPLNYDIDFIRFYLRDRKKAKRTAIQENELKPLHIAGNTSQIKANSESNIVVALDKFTIPDAKYMSIEMNEKNGGRNLSMKVRNNKIMKAIPLSGLN